MQEKEKKKRVVRILVMAGFMVAAFIVWGIIEMAPQQQKDVSGGGGVNDIKKTAPVVVEELPTAPVVKAPKEEGGAEMLVLTPQQLAQANEMLAAFEGKPLNELIQVYGVMQMAAVSVSPEDRPVFEFVLAKLGVYIAELER